jgi:small subunit ribosomal protein S1
MSEPEDFAALLAEYEGKGARTGRRNEPRVGDKVTGTIVSIGREHVFVDLGAKFEGAIELEQVSDGEGTVLVKVGDPIEATVVRKDDKTGSLLLRSRVGRGREARADLEHAYANGLPVEGLVTGVNKGGVEVQVAGVRSFCPISQLDLRYVEDPEQYVGQRFSFRITRYEPGRQLNLVVSRRALLEEEARAEAEKTRARLEVGAVLPGKVTAVKSYGAFVDLGGVEGMIHISELSFGRVERPEDVLSVGQQVEVVVLRIEQTGDRKRPEKIALSARALERDPWQDAEHRFAVGTSLRGTVVRMQPFGVFVELAPGVEGLVHISELSFGRRINHPREVVKEGAAVEVKILAVEPEKRRISLSMAAVATDQQAAAESEAVRNYSPANAGLGTLGDLLKKRLSGD